MREHRKFMRLAGGAVAGLVIFVAAAVAAGSILAVGQADTARSRERLATARKVAALAGGNVTTHLDLTQLLATRTNASRWPAPQPAAHPWRIPPRTHARNARSR